MRKGQTDLRYRITSIKRQGRLLNLLIFRGRLI